MECNKNNQVPVGAQKATGLITWKSLRELQGKTTLEMGFTGLYMTERKRTQSKRHVGQWKRSERA